MNTEVVYRGGPQDGMVRHESAGCAVSRRESRRIHGVTPNAEAWFHRYERVGNELRYMGLFNHLADLAVDGSTPKRWQDFPAPPPPPLFAPLDAAPRG